MKSSLEYFCIKICSLKSSLNNIFWPCPLYIYVVQHAHIQQLLPCVNTNTYFYALSKMVKRSLRYYCNISIHLFIFFWLSFVGNFYNSVAINKNAVENPPFYLLPSIIRVLILKKLRKQNIRNILKT